MLRSTELPNETENGNGSLVSVESSVTLLLEGLVGKLLVVPLGTEFLEFLLLFGV